MSGKLLPGGNVFLRVMPHKMTKDEAHGCLDSWVRNAVYKIENVWTHVAGTNGTNGRGSPDEISQTIE